MAIRHPQDQVLCWILGTTLQGTETIQLPPPTPQIRTQHFLSFQGTAMSISFPTILNFRNRTVAMNLSYWVSLLRNIQYRCPEASIQPSHTQCL